MQNKRRLASPVALAILSLLLPPSALHAQSAPLSDTGHFTINQGTHPVGRSDFSIQPVRQGNIAVPAAYAVSSHGTISLQNTKYSFSSTGSLDKDLTILSESLNGAVNGEAVTFNVRDTGGNLMINISANGRNSQNSLSRPAQTVFFPDFDLAAYETLLTLAARRPGTPISAFIPKQNGSILAATLAPQADVQGTLNGVKLTIHHTSLTIGQVVSELYYSRTSHIVEVDIPGQTFAVVRDNFQLQQPPPPPPSAAPDAQQPAAAAPSNQPQ